LTFFMKQTACVAVDPAGCFCGRYGIEPDPLRLSDHSGHHFLFRRAERPPPVAPVRPRGLLCDRAGGDQFIIGRHRRIDRRVDGVGSGGYGRLLFTGVAAQNRVYVFTDICRVCRRSSFGMHAQGPSNPNPPNSSGHELSPAQSGSCWPLCS